MAFFGATGDAKAADNFWASSASDGYGVKEGKYGIDKSILNRPGMSDAADAFYDTKTSDAFQGGLKSDMASIAGRSTPTAGYNSIGPGGYMKAATLGPMAGVGASSLATGDSDAVRAQQMAALARYGSIASGAATGPGVAQLQQNLAATKAANTSLAGSGAARFNVATGMRGLADRNADASQSTAAASEIVKAQEQQDAIKMMASMSSAARGADMETANANAGLAAQAGYFNAGAGNAAAMARAGFGQSANLFNADASQKDSAMRHAVNMANLEASLRAQGLNDQAIAARMTMLGQQINTDKQAQMSYWDLAAGNQKFSGEMDYRRLMDQQNATNMQYAAAGQGAAAFGGAMSGYGGDGLSQGGWGKGGSGSYGYDSGLAGMGDSYYGKPGSKY